MKLQLGINKCSNADYHADTNFLSSSNLKLLLKDPEQFYKEKILGQKEVKESAAFTVGSLTHSLILEPQLVNKEYAFFEGLRRQGEKYEQFLKDNPGKVVISKPQRIQAEAYKDSYLNCKKALNILNGGEPEATICQMLDDVPIKVRCDYINTDKGYIVDVKTTSFDSDVNSFRVTVKQFGYDLSAALYAEVASKFYGKPFDFYFIVINKKTLACDVFKASKDTMSKGQVEVYRALSIYKNCLKTNKWELQESNEAEDTEEILEV